MANTSMNHPTASLQHWMLTPPPRVRFTHVQMGPNPTDLVASVEFETGREKEMIAWFRQFADAKEADIQRLADFTRKQQLPLEIISSKPSTPPTVPETPKRSDNPL